MGSGEGLQRVQLGLLAGPRPKDCRYVPAATRSQVEATAPTTADDAVWCSLCGHGVDPDDDADSKATASSEHQHANDEAEAADKTHSIAGPAVAATKTEAGTTTIAGSIGCARCVQQ